MNKFDEAVIEAIKRNDKLLVGDFDCKYIEIMHQDGSIYHIRHAKIEKINVDWFPCILVFAEHNSPNVFSEFDLESVKIKPWKGREKKLKLSKFNLKHRFKMPK